VKGASMGIVRLCVEDGVGADARVRRCTCDIFG